MTRGGLVETRTRDDWKVDLPEGKVGDIEVKRFTVEENSLENLRLAIKGGRQTRPGEYTQLLRRGRLWSAET